MIIKNADYVGTTGKEHYEIGGRGRIITYNPFVNGDDEDSHPVFILMVPQNCASMYTSNDTWRTQYVIEYDEDANFEIAGNYFNSDDGNVYMINNTSESKGTISLYAQSKYDDNVFIPSEVEIDGRTYTVNSINGNYFNNSTFKKIYSKATTPFDLSSYSFNSMTFLFSTLFVPFGSKEKYMDATIWNKFSNIQEIDFATGINQSIIKGSSNKEKEWYQINGVLLEKPQQGLNIMKYKDGIVQKTFIK